MDPKWHYFHTLITFTTNLTHFSTLKLNKLIFEILRLLKSNWTRYRQGCQSNLILFIFMCERCLLTKCLSHLSYQNKERKSLKSKGILIKSKKNRLEETCIRYLRFFAFWVENKPDETGFQGADHPTILIPKQVKLIPKQEKLLS